MRPVLPEVTDPRPERYPYRVFLSHASADKPIVRKFADRLKAEGITYWIDEEQITFGDQIVSKIEDGLQASQDIVVCLSDNQARSGWCRAEYGPILYREFSGETGRRVIPLSLDGSNSKVPLLLSDKMRADLTDPASLEAFIAFLRKSNVP